MSRALCILNGDFGRAGLQCKDRPVAPHTHQDHQILIHYDGAAGFYNILGSRYPFNREHMLLVNAMTVHDNLGGTGASAVMLLCLYLKPAWLAEILPAVFASSEPKPFPVPGVKVTARIRRLADTLAVELANSAHLTRERLEFLVFEIVLELVNAYVRPGRSAAGLWAGSRLSDVRIRRALGVMRQDPTKAIRMDDLGRSAGLSRSRFFSLFQLCTGVSPGTYLDMLCMERAISCLSTSDIKVSDLAAELGFAAPSHFTRFFIQHIGLAPSDYRRAVSEVDALQRHTGT